jgi:hypothetical protein
MPGQYRFYTKIPTPRDRRFLLVCSVFYSQSSLETTTTESFLFSKHISWACCNCRPHDSERSARIFFAKELNGNRDWYLNLLLGLGKSEREGGLTRLYILTPFSLAANHGSLQDMLLHGKWSYTYTVFVEKMCEIFCAKNEKQ